MARSIVLRTTLVGLALLGLPLAACSAADPEPTGSAPAPATAGATPGATQGASTGAGPDADPVPAPEPSTPPPAPATTPVPAPTPGDVSSTLRPRKVQRKSPVGLEAPASPQAGVSVELTEVKAVQAEAKGPGEVSGPALQVAVRVTNAGSGDIDLGSSVVSLVDARGVPGAPMVGPPATPLTGELAAGARASGVYLFDVPLDARKTVTIDVSVEGSLPTVVFQGKP